MPKLSLGFTLIEVLVAISILGIAALVAIPNYHRFNETQKLSNAASGLASALKAAETNAQSRISCYDSSNVAQVPYEWKVTINTSLTDVASNTYTLKCDYLNFGVVQSGYVQPGTASLSYPTKMISAVTLTNNVGGTCSDTSPTVIFSSSGVSFTSSCAGNLIKMLINLSDSPLPSACLDIEKGGVISLVSCP